MVPITDYLMCYGTSKMLSYCCASCISNPLIIKQKKKQKQITLKKVILKPRTTTRDQFSNSTNKVVDLFKTTIENSLFQDYSHPDGQTIR